MRRAILAFFLLALSVSAVAVEPTYTDVPDGMWFTEAVKQLTRDGYFDATKTEFRPSAKATRAEFLKLTLALGRITPGNPPLLPSFDDVPKHAWYFPHFEEAGKENIVRGDGNCFGSHPCRAYPESGIERSEAAALIVRVFAIERKGTSPRFVDVGDPDWFAYAMYALADHCLLKGDQTTLRVRPHDNLNRAEMAVLFRRLQLMKAGENVCPKS